ncbi:MAG: hypothetical protein MK108_10655 [Mariniblastus sp.]|nr:hypothetical protein [Mariniblastus sp.]
MLKSFLTGTSCFVLVSLLSSGVSGTEWVDTPTDHPDETSYCQTKVKFHTDYVKAFELAKRTGKPLFVLQLSGDLKNATFT